MPTPTAKNITLNEVHRTLGFQRHIDGSFEPLLSLEPLSEFEQQQLLEIRQDFDSYLASGNVSEGQVKFLILSPLMKLAGFFRSPIEITLEEDIEQINIQNNGDTEITGRMDILGVKKAQSTEMPRFWILLIEAKRSGASAMQGLPQLLTYAFTSLERQEAVWGLTTNGEIYRFVYIEPKNYRLMPLLNIVDREPSNQLLQVLKAICKRQAAN